VRYGIGFITQINQAHNGYLDLLLAVGVAGLVAYVGVVIGFIHCLSVAEHQSQNRTLALCWVFFIFSLFAQHNRVNAFTRLFARVGHATDCHGHHLSHGA
jgi:O-antigen ligase